MKEHCYDWVVIGAGPAGIAAVGQLLDANTMPQQVAWIDPAFHVGDFGTIWKYVHSNTPVKAFLDFYNAFSAFEFHQPREQFMIETMQLDATCPLMLAAQPLQWITRRLQDKVIAKYSTAQGLRLTPEGWLVQLACGQTLLAKKVILALGAEALTLPYSTLTPIPLKVAANPVLLKKAIDEHDTIAVFGSYQSARTVQENLTHTVAKKIIHFYRSERSFKQHVASLKLSSRVESYPITSTNLLTYIPHCNKAIYAVGFARRTISIQGLPDDFLYHPETGQIASGLYGLGIAFPEVLPYTKGRIAYKVTAIWPFIQHLRRIFPIWLTELTTMDELQPVDIE